MFASNPRYQVRARNSVALQSKSNQIKSNMTLIMVDKPQPSYNLLNNAVHHRQSEIIKQCRCFQPASPPRELTCHTESLGVTCHPADVIDIPAFTAAKLVLDLATPERRRAELTKLAGYIPRWYTRAKTVTHRSTGRARRGITSLIFQPPLPAANVHAGTESPHFAV